MSCKGCQLNNSNSEIDNRVNILTNHDWLNDLPDTSDITDIVEISFKGTRKDFYKNEYKIALKRGDTVVVASAGGHDVGVVSLTGKLAEKQFERKVISKNRHQWFSIYRVANDRDKERWKEALDREKSVMIRARQIASNLGLEMKIGDVEFRGDGNKAIFYYIAEGRIDFRELIKEYALEFRIKIEMKQIGARQEAARIGGIGSCGRELCCSSWRTDFSSITAHMATRQGLSSNAEKLTGRCGKLKCCLMYELDTYLEAQEEFPANLLELETSSGIAKKFKIDILSGKIWYNINHEKNRHTFVLSIDKVKEVINLNKRGKKPDLASLIDVKVQDAQEEKNMFNQNLVFHNELGNKKIQTKKKTFKRNKSVISKNSNTTTVSSNTSETNNNKKIVNQNSRRNNNKQRIKFNNANKKA